MPRCCSRLTLIRNTVSASTSLRTSHHHFATPRTLSLDGRPKAWLENGFHMQCAVRLPVNCSAVLSSCLLATKWPIFLIDPPAPPFSGSLPPPFPPSFSWGSPNFGFALFGALVVSRKLLLAGGRDRKWFPRGRYARGRRLFFSGSPGGPRAGAPPGVGAPNKSSGRVKTEVCEIRRAGQSRSLV